MEKETLRSVAKTYREAVEIGEEVVKGKISEKTLMSNAAPVRKVSDLLEKIERLEVEHRDAVEQLIEKLKALPNGLQARFISIMTKYQEQFEGSSNIRENAKHETSKKVLNNKR